MSLRVTLSSDDRVHFMRLCDRLVQETMAERTDLMARYDESDDEQDQEEDDEPLWTPLKPTSKEDPLRLFVKNGGSQHTGFPEFWGHATLRNVSLEEAMYGLVTPTSGAMLFRSVCLEEHVVAAKVLAKVEVPNEEKPFQSLAIKWAMKNIPLRMGTISRPRDFVFMESTGVMSLPQANHPGADELETQEANHDDEQAQQIQTGYHVVHSVEIPSCYEFNSCGIIRSQMKYCVLFQEDPSTKGQLRVFFKGRFHFGGSMRSQVVVRLAREQLISTCTKVMDCVDSKKLFWMSRGLGRGNGRISRGNSVNSDLTLLTSLSSASSFGSSGSPSSSSSTSNCFCHNCSRPFRTLGCRSYGCAICQQQVCRHCLVASTRNKRLCRRLTRMSGSKWQICATCWSSTHNRPVMEFVAQEFGPSLDTNVIRDFPSNHYELQENRGLITATRLRIQGHMPFDTKDLMETKQTPLVPLRAFTSTTSSTSS